MPDGARRGDVRQCIVSIVYHHAASLLVRFVINEILLVAGAGIMALFYLLSGRRRITMVTRSATRTGMLPNEIALFRPLNAREKYHLRGL